MTIKDIVLYQGQDSRSAARLDFTIALAQAYEARVTGVYVLSYPAIPTYVEVELGSEFIEERKAELHRMADEAKQAFEDRLKRDGISGEWRQMRGTPVEAMTLAVHYADIAVVAQANPDEPMPEDNMADQLALSAGRPVMVVPYVGNFPKVGERIMVAWNGTREAARAVHDAMPFLTRADDVIVYCVNPPDSDHIVGAEISAHLARHGVKADGRHGIAPDLDVGDVLLSAAADFGTDLLVMGAYGHSRIRELALGGATRHLLRTMTLPVLMSH